MDELRRLFISAIRLAWELGLKTEDDDVRRHLADAVCHLMDAKKLSQVRDG